jgi:Skp family chaperone for outer membrane proteins
VFNKLKALIATVAKEDGFDLVLDTDQTVYAKDAVDITEKVKKRFKGMKSN